MGILPMYTATRERHAAMPRLLPDIYTHLLRPLLFRLPPETAQTVADAVLRRRPLWRALAPLLRVEDRRLTTDWCGIGLRNPVGLAAGLDKDCRALPSLSAWGFGYLVAGTVTEFSRPGNAKPRMFRDADRRSLVNALGFPGAGLEEAARRLERALPLPGTPVAASVSGATVEEFVRCHARLEPLVDAVELNISSPNTAGLRLFHRPETLGELVGRVNDGRTKPLMVKLPPYPDVGSTGSPEDEVARKRALSLVRACVESGVDGLTVANSRPVNDSRLAVGVGGLSGQAVFPDTLRMVADVRREAGLRVAINACGGIFSGDDAWRALAAGATTVQLYTAAVYRGPSVVSQINRRLLAIMAAEGVESLPPSS